VLPQLPESRSASCLGGDELAVALLGRLATAATILLRHAGAYAVLIRGDLQAAHDTLRRRAIAAAVLCISLLLALQIACGALIAAAWNTPARPWVVGGLLFVLVLCGVAAWYRLRALSDPRARAAASHTAGEWAKDRELLLELLARLRAPAEHETR
jgi:hypothetical protein